MIVTTRRRGEGCRRLCTAVQRQFDEHPGVPWEIILVFDGCPQYGWVSDEYPYVVVALPDQVGIARARNAGLSAAAGDVVAFLDDDCVPATTWLNTLLDALDRYPDRIAFGGWVLGTDTVNLYSQLRDRVYYFETFGSWYGDVADDGDRFDPPYINGGNAAYRRKAIVAVGGFDPLLPAYSDVDLGRRLQTVGGLILVAGMNIHHDHPSTFGQYMLRCYRSGRARALLWRRRRYPQDAPPVVFGAVVVNIVWTNLARRARRIDAPCLKTTAVLFCQEVMHGIAYAQGLLGGGRGGAEHICGRPGRAAGVGGG